MRVATAIIAVAVPTAISRTGTVGIVIAILIVAVDWSWRRRANMAALAILVATAVAVAVPRLLGTLRGLVESLFGRNSASINGRTSDYTNVKPYLHGHLLLGRGQGTFQVGQYFTLDNQYLNELLAAGIIGVAAVLGLYLTIMALSRGARKRGRDVVDRSLGQALTASGAVLAFSAATFDLFGFTQALGLTFLLLGVSGAFWRLTWYEAKAREAAERGAEQSRGEPVLVG
jgi:O-antigen ligase